MLTATFTFNWLASSPSVDIADVSRRLTDGPYERVQNIFINAIIGLQNSTPFVPPANGWEERLHRSEHIAAGNHGSKKSRKSQVETRSLSTTPLSHSLTMKQLDGILTK